MHLFKEGRQCKYIIYAYYQRTVSLTKAKLQLMNHKKLELLGNNTERLLRMSEEGESLSLEWPAIQFSSIISSIK